MGGGGCNEQGDTPWSRGKVGSTHNLALVHGLLSIEMFIHPNLTNHMRKQVLCHALYSLSGKAVEH